jgi:hypothetical protein
MIALLLIQSLEQYHSTKSIESIYSATVDLRGTNGVAGRALLEAPGHPRDSGYNSLRVQPNSSFASVEWTAEGQAHKLSQSTDYGDNPDLAYQMLWKKPATGRGDGRDQEQRESCRAVPGRSRRLAC